MFTAPVGPVEVVFLLTQSHFWEFGAIGALLASSPDAISIGGA